MRSSEIVMILTDNHKKITDVADECILALKQLFSAEGMSNDEAHGHANMHNAMVDYIIWSVLQSSSKKNTDKAKEALDIMARHLGIDTSAVPGIPKPIYSNDVLSYIKKQNKMGTQVTVQDFELELNKAGVDPVTIKKCREAAEKPKTGNTYYMVGAGE